MKKRNRHPSPLQRLGAIGVSLFLIGAILIAAQGVEGQTGRVDGDLEPCEHGRIIGIFVDNQGIFRVDPLAPEERFAWTRDLVNRLHLTTRRGVILRELLFESGDCFDSALVMESERLLREFRFIAAAEIESLLQPDGNHYLIIETRDEWTTKINPEVRINDGLKLQGLEVREENFIGRGIFLGAYFREREEKRDFGMIFETPQLFRSRWSNHLSVGRTRSGWTLEQAVVYPFLGEGGRVAFRQSFSRRATEFPYVLPDTAISHVILPVLDESFEAAGAIRFGRPGSMTLVGLGLSTTLTGYRDFPAGVEAIRRGNFDDPLPVGDSITAILESQAGARSMTRVNLLLGQRNLRFIRRQGLDAIHGVQDVPIGFETGVTIGRSVRPFTDGFGSASAPHFFSRFDLFLGAASDSWLSQTRMSFEGRRLLNGADRWRDIFSTIDSYLYWQPEGSRHTVLARASRAGGWYVEVPFQLTLGGSDGLRGYREEEFPAGRRSVLTLEDRIAVDWPLSDVMDLGVTLFADIGWGEEGRIPFARDSGTKASAGAGLRIGFPTGTSGVVRMDLALPLESGLGPGDVIFRISLVEPLGLIRGFRDPQLSRSLRTAATTDFSRIGSHDEYALTTIQTRTP